MKTKLIPLTLLALLATGCTSEYEYPESGSTIESSEVETAVAVAPKTEPAKVEPAKVKPIVKPEPVKVETVPAKVEPVATIETPERVIDLTAPVAGDSSEPNYTPTKQQEDIVDKFCKAMKVTRISRLEGFGSADFSAVLFTNYANEPTKMMRERESGVVDTSKPKKEGYVEYTMDITVQIKFDGPIPQWYKTRLEKVHIREWVGDWSELEKSVTRKSMNSVITGKWNPDTTGSGKPVKVETGGFFWDYVD